MKRKNHQKWMIRKLSAQLHMRPPGEEYERLRAEAGLSLETESTLIGNDLQRHRGLENLGGASGASSGAGSGED
jgi:hypothetical protein